MARGRLFPFMINADKITVIIKRDADIQEAHYEHSGDRSRGNGDIVWREAGDGGQ